MLLHGLGYVWVCVGGFGSALCGCKGCVEVGAILELFTGAGAADARASVQRCTTLCCYQVQAKSTVNCNEQACNVSQ